MKKIFFYLLVLFLFIILPLTWESREPSTHFRGIGIFTIIFLTWFVIRTRSEKKIQIPKIVPLLLLFIALQAILTYFSPAQEIGFIWIIVELYILVFFIFTLDTINNDQGRNLWENLLIGSALLYAGIDIIYLLSWYGNWFHISGSIFSKPPLIKRATGSFLSHPNLLSSYLNLVIPLALVRFVRSVKKSERILWLIILAILLIGNYLTYSRAGWFSLVGGLIVTLFLLYSVKLNIQVDYKQLISARKLSWYWYLGGIILSITLVGLFYFIRWQLGTSAHGTLGDRLDIYTFVLGWIKNSPLWGYGTASTPSIFALREYAIGGDEIYHAHNLWLQVTLEAGIIGLSLLILMVGFVIKAYRSSWLDWREDPQKRASLAAYTGVGVAILIQSLFDMAFVKVAYNLAIATIIALVYSLAPKKEFMSLRKKVTIPVLIGLILVSGISLIYFERSISPYWKGKDAATQGDWHTARDEICYAANLNQTNAFYSFQCSLANAFVAANDNTVNGLSDAVRYQQQALELNSQWYVHWANLASYEWVIGDRAIAIEDMQKALDLAPNRVFLSTNLAWMNEQEGNELEAYKSYQRSYCMNPWLEWTTLFQLSEIFQLAAQDDCPPEIDMLSNNPFQRLLIQGWQSYQAGDLAEAELQLQQAAEANPQSGVPFAYLALVHHQNGNLQEARKNIQIALLIQNGSATIHKKAAELDFANNKDEPGYMHLVSAFTIIEQSSLSEKYYWHAYFDKGLPTDLAPPFLYPKYNPGWTEDLSIYLEDSSDSFLKNRVNKWLDRNKLSQELWE